MTETTHLCPPGDSALMPCCNKTPFEVPRTDRMTVDRSLVTCHPEFQCPYAEQGQTRCPEWRCDCFIDTYPDDPFGLHPEAFVVGRVAPPDESDKP